MVTVKSVLLNYHWTPMPIGATISEGPGNVPAEGDM